MLFNIHEYNLFLNIIMQNAKTCLASYITNKFPLKFTASEH